MIKKLSDNRVTYGTRLSDRIWQDSNGQLICRDCIIARTGSYDYLESEVIENGDENKVVKVYRTDDQVFDATSIASFENKPLCNDHPSEDVTPDNYRELQCGFMRNIRRGHGELDNCLICDVIVTDPEVIELIKSGEKRELSLGYSTDIVSKDGKYFMTKIRGNHLALVDSGRAGCATIRDSASRFNKKTGGNRMFQKSKKKSFHLFDEDIIEVQELSEEPAVEDDDIDLGVPEDVAAEEVPAEEPVQDDAEGITLDALNAKMDVILDYLKKIAGETVADEAVEEVAGEEEIVPDEVADEDEIEEISEEEFTEDCGTTEMLETDSDEDVEEIEDCDVVEEDCDTVEDEDTTEEELLDADELLPEEKVTDKKTVTKKTKKDSKSVYSKFAGITDTAHNLQADIQKSFQSRYDRCANKI